MTGRRRMGGGITPCAIWILLLAVAGQPLVTQPLLAEPRSFTDSAGREFAVPDVIQRVMVAGPPAAVLLYTLAPDRMIGWVQTFDADQTAFRAEPYRALPRHGRITARDKAPDDAAIHPVRRSDIITSYWPTFRPRKA